MPAVPLEGLRGRHATEELRKGPLEGITVLDFSRVLAGPYCAPTLNQHREAILHEFMAPRESYAPSHRDEGEEPAPGRPWKDNVTKISAE